MSTEHGMDGSCPLLFPSFGEQSGSERGGGYSSQKLGVYRPGADAIDLGYHTLDNNACRTTSASSSSSTLGIVPNPPIRQQHQQQQPPLQSKHHLVHHAVADLCQLDDSLLLRIFSWLGTRD
ncbi:hypothetical protein X777_00180, partial [Ooceraea biroi]